MAMKRSRAELLPARSILKGNSPGETNWLLDDDELNESNGIDSELSQHEAQTSNGLFTYFDGYYEDGPYAADYYTNGQEPPSRTLSQVSFRPHQEFSEEAVALGDYYSGSTATAYEGDKRTYTCFYLSAAAVALLIASFGISLWWSVNHDDVSGGFGMGSYMLAVSSVIIAIATYMHRQHCRCWVHGCVSPS
ncbi:hypothetical protein F4781DRAFT_329473 [Annulohypoxylon bovei var. microspora]|nr:hypothetical protein F4781DRAFT_329473 [Annulohypoxylon bovei var. microspora]